MKQWIFLMVILPSMTGGAFAQVTAIQSLTVAQEAHLKGPALFGVLAEDTAQAGFKVDVVQASHVSWEEGTPYYEYETIYHEGYLDTRWEFVDTWDWVDRSYWQEGGNMQEVWHDVWIDPEYDEDGNMIADGYYEQYSEWVETEGYWVEDIFWGIVASEWTQITEWIEPWEEEVSTWIEPGMIETTVYEKPVVRFTGMRSDTVWLWQNPSASPSADHRWLMKLSKGGLQFPSPLGGNIFRKALINHQTAVWSEMLEQEGDDPAQALGAKITKGGVNVWAEQGDAAQDDERLAAPFVRMETKLAHDALEIQRAQPTADGAATAVMTTRIVADHASFGGSVAVKGVLLINPQGDIGMGEFQNGPRP